MPSLKDFVLALQAGWFPALAALVGCSVVIAGDYYQFPYLDVTPPYILTILVLVAVFSASVLIANIVYLPIKLFKFVRKRALKKKHRALLVQEVEDAPEAEVAVLAYLISANRKAFTAEFNDRRLAPLVSKGLIVKLGGAHSVLDWPYVVQNDVWRHLKDNADRFQMDVTGMGDPFNWRTGPL